MTVITTEEMLKRIGELNVHTLVYTGKEVEDAIVALVTKDKPVLGVYEGAWKNYSTVRMEIEKKGGNPFLYIPLDPLEFRFIKEVEPKNLVHAKHSALLSFMAQNTPYKAKSTKTVDRRTLLSSPLKAIMEYYPAPILLQPETCKAWKYCSNCVENCPFNALTGKPPEVLLDNCTSCGLCTGSCPFALLYMPQWNVESLGYLLSIIRRYSGKPGYIVGVCNSSLSLLESLSVKETSNAPVLFINIECPGWVNDYHVLIAASLGFSFVHFCDEGRIEKCGGRQLFEKQLDNTSSIGTYPKIASSIEELSKIIVEPLKLPVLGEDYSIIKEKTNVYKLLEALGVSEINFSNPVAGIVEVDEENCLVCDACSNLCPFKALSIEDTEGERRLVFSMVKCTACGVCEKVCPYGVLNLKYGYKKELMGKDHVLAKDELARCRRCGKPIGSKKHILSLEKKLRESGADEWVIEQLWLCPECKMKSVIERQMGKN